MIFKLALVVNEYKIVGLKHGQHEHHQPNHILSVPNVLK